MSNRLLIAWPGETPHQERVWAWLKDNDLASDCDFCLQINSFHNGASGFPETLARDLTRVKAAAAAERCMNRDWHPKEPTHCYYDYEPHEQLANGGKRAWMWEAWLDGYDSDDQKMIHTARQEIEAWQEEQGHCMKAGLYGVPVVLGRYPRGFRITDAAKWQAAENVLTGWDWVFLNMYPPSGTVPADWIDDAAPHTQRAETNYRAAVGMYQDREVIPFLWPRWGMDAGRYGEVYIDALLNAGCNRLGLWINPHTESMTSVYLQAMTDMLPSLRRFVGGGK